MKHKLAKSVGILFIAIFAAVVTELALGLSHQTAESPDRTTVKVAATPTPSPLPTATPTPTPTPTVAPTLPTAVTNGFVHLRAATSTSSTDLADLQAGTTVELNGAAQGLWQPVIYQGTSGYIYTSYLTY